MDVQNPEEQLITLVLKYRDAANKGEYLPVTEREQDRQRLNDSYQDLSTIRQRILDSKCYLEMGRLQKELSDRFLADNTTPTQRLDMLAYLVKSLRYPLVFLCGRNTITTDYHLQENTVVHLEIEEKNEPDLSHGRSKPCFVSYPISAEEIKQIQSEVKHLHKQHQRLVDWLPLLSRMQAEIFSQLTASGELKIALEQNSPCQQRTMTSMVVKEFVYGHDRG